MEDERKSGAGERAAEGLRERVVAVGERRAGRPLSGTLQKLRWKKRRRKTKRVNAHMARHARRFINGSVMWEPHVGPGIDSPEKGELHER